MGGSTSGHLERRNTKKTRTFYIIIKDYCCEVLKTLPSGRYGSVSFAVGEEWHGSPPD